MAEIKVPRTPRSSFNPNRRPSALLLEQIRHLEWAALPAMQRAPGGDLPKKTVKTEGAAADRIAQLTRLVQAQHATRTTDGTVQPVTLPPLPRAGGSAPAAKRSVKPRPKARGARARAKKPKATSAKAATSAKGAGTRGKKAASYRSTHAARAKTNRTRGRRARSSR